MNDVQVFIDRQLGIYCGAQYDGILKRLIVGSNDSFHGVQSSLSTADFNPDPPIFACRFAEASGYEHILALANEDGRVAIQDTSRAADSLTDTPLEGFQCHNNAVFDLAWMPGDMKFVTVSGDHSACLWDIEEGMPKHVQLFSSHTRSVKTAVFRPADPSIFATGARDGHVLVWDIRSNTNPPVIIKPDNFLLNCHSSFTPKTPVSGPKRQYRPDNIRATSITGLVFQDDMTLISCGECDGNIKVWDLRKNYNIYKKDPLPKHSIPYRGSSTKNGYTNLIIDDARVRLYASCMDNVIYCFNIATYNTLAEQRYIGHENSTFYIKTSLSPDCRYLVSGSSDKNAYVWNVKYSEPVVKLVGHSAEVTCAAWCQKGDTKIVTCSDDARHKIWRIGNEFYNDTEKVELRGQAETVPKTELASNPHWWLHKTPNSVKRKQPRVTPTTGAKRVNRTSPSASTSFIKSKRCLTDMLNATKVDTDDGPHCSKRLKFDLPPVAESNENRDPKKCLSSNDNAPGPSACSSSKRAYTSDMMMEGFQQHSHDVDWIYTSPTKKLRAETFSTPTKYYQHTSPKLISPRKSPRNEVESPRKFLSPRRSPREHAAASSSPTVNLPNYVLDGEAPHLRLMSPIKKKQETTNWLTRIVREKKGKCGEAEKNGTLSPLSPLADNVVSRRSSTSSDRTPKRNGQKKTLLKYFNVVGSKDK